MRPTRRRGTVGPARTRPQPRRFLRGARPRASAERRHWHRRRTATDGSRDDFFPPAKFTQGAAHRPRLHGPETQRHHAEAAVSQEYFPGVRQMVGCQLNLPHRFLCHDPTAHHAWTQSERSRWRAERAVLHKEDISHGPGEKPSFLVMEQRLIEALGTRGGLRCALHPIISCLRTAGKRRDGPEMKSRRLHIGEISRQ